jgi:hypothetical protein
MVDRQAMDRRKLIVLIALVAPLLVAALLVGRWWPAPSEQPLAQRTGEEQRSSERERAREHSSSEPREREPTARAIARERQATFDRAKRDALRSEILQALAERPPRPAAQPSEDEPRPSGGLTDRIGGREALMEHLNHDFMPLADECIEQARARRPELEGMIAIGLDTVADAELGGIVEAVTVQPQNEVDDAELLECLSQTALSMILPPPPESAREQFEITMPLEPQSQGE